MMIILLLMHSEWVAENIGCIEYIVYGWRVGKLYNVVPGVYRHYRRVVVTQSATQTAEITQ